MKRIAVGLVPLLLLGCRGTHEGTSVGNPSTMQLSVADANGATFRRAEVNLDELNMVPCDGQANELLLTGQYDLLDPEEVELPPGQWCAVSFTFTGKNGLDLSVERGGGTFRVALALDSLVLFGGDGFTFAHGAYVFELGQPGWLDPDDVGPGETVNDEHPLHGELVENIEVESGVWIDRNADGVIEEDERTNGPIAGTQRQEETRSRGGDDDGGCNTAAPRVGWTTLGAVLFWMRRRT